MEDLQISYVKALVREQQKAQELTRLQEALSKLINEAGKRTRQEVDNVRKQCNVNIAKLMEEIQSMETVSEWIIMGLCMSMSRAFRGFFMMMMTTVRTRTSTTPPTKATMTMLLGESIPQILILN